MKKLWKLITKTDIAQDTLHTICFTSLFSGVSIFTYAGANIVLNEFKNYEVSNPESWAVIGASLILYGITVAGIAMVINTIIDFEEDLRYAKKHLRYHP